MTRLVCLALLCLSSTTAAKRGPSQTAAVLFRSWVALIEGHVGGQRDDAVLAAARLTALDREMLSQGLPTFAALMLRPDSRPPRTSVIRDADIPSLRELAMDESRRLTLAQLMHRAVILHTDAAVLAADVIAETYAADAPRPPSAGGTVAQGEDGRLQSMSERNWHFDFARELIDESGAAGADPFAVAWYHAVAVHQLEQQLFGELLVHLPKAAALFPRDARILLDRACYAEALGSDPVQVFVATATFPRGFRPAVPSRNATDRSAINLLERAIEIDPRLTEARVRLARLHEAHGGAGLALKLLPSSVLAEIADPYLLYFARMTAGRASAALGLLDQATGHYRAALTLFPKSQAPVLGLSLMSLNAGDIDAAVAMAATLRSDSGAVDRDDPFWSYFGGTWRDGAGLLAAVRRDALK